MKHRVRAFTISAVLLFIVLSVAVTRPSRYNSDRNGSTMQRHVPVQITASLSVPVASVANLVHDAMAASFAEARRAGVRNEILRVAHRTDGNVLDITAFANGVIAIPLLEDPDYDMRASVAISPAIDNLGRMRFNLELRSERFRLDGAFWDVDWSDEIQSGPYLDLSTPWPVPDVSIPWVGLNSVAESIDEATMDATREAMKEVWSSLCDAHPSMLDVGDLPEWMVVRPIGLRLYPFQLSQSTADVRVGIDAEVSWSEDRGDNVECPSFPGRVTYVDWPGSGGLGKEVGIITAAMDGVEAALAVRVGYEALGKLVDVPSLAGQLSESPVGPWTSELVVEDVYMRSFYGLDSDIGSPDGALLFAVDVSTRMVGSRRNGTVYFAGMVQTDDDSGEMFVTDVELVDTESRDLLLALVLEVGEASMSRLVPDGIELPHVNSFLKEIVEDDGIDYGRQIIESGIAFVNVSIDDIRVDDIAPGAVGFQVVGRAVGDVTLDASVIRSMVRKALRR